MAFDGFAVAAVVAELREKILGARVDKVFQPERDELIINVRGGANFKLFLTASAASPRAHLTTIAKENPMQAPQFAMTLRKHLTPGRIADIIQPDFERVIEFHIESATEMGDLTVKKLIIEMMGKHSNIILTDAAGKIIDSIKRVTQEKSRVREVLPGLIYTRPPSDKTNPLTESNNGFIRRFVSSDLNAQKAVYLNYTGVSPILASEMLHRADIDAGRPAASVSADEAARLFAAFESFSERAKSGEFECHIYKEETGKPADFSVFDMGVYAGYEDVRYTAISALLDDFYAQKDDVNRIAQKSQDLRKLVSGFLDRAVRKLDIQEKAIADTLGREENRVFGELITANIYAIKQGQTSLITQNYYEEDTPEVTILLDTQKTPSQNAQNYFKKYNKQKRTHENATVQATQSREEITYLDGILFALTAVTHEREIDEIRDELAALGYLKARKTKKDGRKTTSTKPLSFTSSDGFTIFVGKNNRQNDELTFSGQGSDMWLHTKDIPGSHVLIVTNNQPVPEKTLEEAAMLAAFYSKGQKSSLVPVDYCLRKYVKKPSGAKPGFVIYTNQKTAYVTPDERFVTALAPKKV